jgi:L-ascorbate metabolism protein UlaG (beta-lactamase superfamily)
LSSRTDGRGRWRRLGYLVAGATLLTLAAASSCATLRPAHDGPVTEHFDGARFHDDPPVHKSFGQVLKWQLEREPGGPWVRDLTPVDRGPVAPRAGAGELAVTFVNHATVLLQLDGLNVVTDPIWTARASPFEWAGPERYRAPGLRFRDLPPVDLVLVSHNHYDHMDRGSLRLLAQDHDPLFVVPLGNCFYLDMVEPDRCVELDWWESRPLGDGRRVHAVPARHWARRGVFDTNRSLWAGFVLETPGRRVYFAGDTGMGDHFAEIRERLGPPDLALLPIGAYLPRWFMAPQHISPEEAVAAHGLLGAQATMAIHFGTFRLADDGQDQPVEELRAAIAAAGAAPDRFWIPAEGETRRWPGDGRVARRD